MVREPCNVDLKTERFWGGFKSVSEKTDQRRGYGSNRFKDRGISPGKKGKKELPSSVIGEKNYAELHALEQVADVLCFGLSVFLKISPIL